MDEPRFAAGLAERTLHGPMIDAGHFHRDDVIADVMFFKRLAQLKHGDLERGATVLDDGGRDKHVAVKVAEHPLGSRFGAIDGDNAEPFRPDGLNARLNHAVGLSKYGWTDSAGFARIAFRSYAVALFSVKRCETP